MGRSWIERVDVGGDEVTRICFWGGWNNRDKPCEYAHHRISVNVVHLLDLLCVK